MSEFEDYLEVSGYYQDENGDFFYSLYLRPWGKAWDDVRAAKGEGAIPSGLPVSYNDYMAAVEAGLDMDSFLKSYQAMG